MISCVWLKGFEGLLCCWASQANPIHEATKRLVFKIVQFKICFLVILVLFAFWVLNVTLKGRWLSFMVVLSLLKVFWKTLRLI